MRKAARDVQPGNLFFPGYKEAPRYIVDVRHMTPGWVRLDFASLRVKKGEKPPKVPDFLEFRSDEEVDVQW